MSQLPSAELLQRFFKNYREDIQITPHQGILISMAIAAAGPKPNVLIYGCGNDSQMWTRMNPNGRTRFLENHPEWLASVQARWPNLEIQEVSYGDWTVSGSLPVDEARLAQYPVPEGLDQIDWDVILIDSPMGHKSDKPGRALPIYWARKLAKPTAQVFIDDYNRGVERAHGDRFLEVTGRQPLVIPRLRKGATRSNLMLWAMPNA
jgi:hypothetical protein